MISAPHATIVKRRLKVKVRIWNGVSAQGTSVLGEGGPPAWPHRRALVGGGRKETRPGQNNAHSQTASLLTLQPNTLIS